MSYFQRKYIFPGQQENEKVCLIIRQHWIVLAGQMLFAVLFVAIYFIVSYVLNTYLPKDLLTRYGNVVGLAKDLYLIFLLLGIFLAWVIYYLNVQIVTNQRVVDITQNGLLQHTVSELELSHIEDVTTEVKGFLPTMFNYGDVYIQTAAEKERFVFSHISRPADVQKLILDLYEQLPKQ
ncbi:MAG: PH domain-containing protein [Candidatus Doudnabacteria bacterium]|nr:PH domain-containing protein [Candidatus Doudnabacteria bacterium]